MAIKMIKPNFTTCKKSNSLSYSNELISLFKSERQTSKNKSGSHYSPRLHIEPVKISQNKGEIEEYSDFDEFELTYSREINDFNYTADRSCFEYFNCNNKFFEFKEKLNKKDSEDLSMNETADETVLDDTSVTSQAHQNNQTLKNISLGLSKFSALNKCKSTELRQLKSCIKRDSQDDMQIRDKRVQFTLTNTKGEQKIVDILDNSDTESESESDESISFYGI